MTSWWTLLSIKSGNFISVVDDIVIIPIPYFSTRRLKCGWTMLLSSISRDWNMSRRRWNMSGERLLRACPKCAHLFDILILREILCIYMYMYTVNVINETVRSGLHSSSIIYIGFTSWQDVAMWAKFVCEARSGWIHWLISICATMWAFSVMNLGTHHQFSSYAVHICWTLAKSGCSMRFGEAKNIPVDFLAPPILILELFPASMHHLSLWPTMK